MYAATSGGQHKEVATSIHTLLAMFKAQTLHHKQVEAFWLG
jgi:hypothetical protein